MEGIKKINSGSAHGVTTSQLDVSKPGSLFFSLGQPLWDPNSNLGSTQLLNIYPIETTGSPIIIIFLICSYSDNVYPCTPDAFFYHTLRNTSMTLMIVTITLSPFHDFLRVFFLLRQLPVINFFFSVQQRYHWSTDIDNKSTFHGKAHKTRPGGGPSYLPLFNRI